MKFLQIDGSFGEGGGQILRTTLALSIITQTPIEISKIRAGRKKPGLMRQHLVCVQAAKAISHATVTGDELGSQDLKFTPHTIQSGRYDFDIGSAGSTTLVLQTILPPLLMANGKSTVTIKGGTHNPLAPTADFLQHAFIPALANMGIKLELELVQAGFAPVGGGEIVAKIYPIDDNERYPNFNLVERGQLLGVELVASELNLQIDIAKRELDSSEKHLNDKNDLGKQPLKTSFHSLKGIGEGNTCYAIVKSQTPTMLHHEVFTLLGEKSRSAENIGKRLAGLVNRYVASNACVDEYLADQLLLPLALLCEKKLFKKGNQAQFTARMISEHTRTQAVMIEKFLPVKIDFTDMQNAVLITIHAQ